MRFAVVASALFAGLVAAAPAITETVQSTAVETITSCGPEVTNCPARSASTSVAATTSVPVVQAVQNTTAGASTVTLYSTQEITITSCAPSVTNCPARISSSVVSVGTTVIPVNNNGVQTSAPFPVQNGTQVQPVGTAASTGLSSATTSYHGPAYTGAASSLNAGMALAGVAGFAALFI